MLKCVHFFGFPVCREKAHPLKQQIEKLFRHENQLVTFYFSGHDHIENTGGYLMTSECDYGDEGISMSELLDIVNKSPAN